MNFLILFILTVSISKAQEDSTSLYFKALFYYNAYIDKNQFDESQIFIETNNGITQKLPKKINKRLITIISAENQLKIYEENNNNIRHVKVYPARANGEFIEIQFTPYFGEYRGKRKGYNLALSYWVVIQFKFDCETKTFKYFNTSSGGI